MPSPNTNIDDLLETLVIQAVRFGTDKTNRLPDDYIDQKKEQAKTQLEALLTAAKISELKNVQKAANKLERMDACGCDNYIPCRIKELEEKQ